MGNECLREKKKSHTEPPLWDLCCLEKAVFMSPHKASNSSLIFREKEKGRSKGKIKKITQSSIFYIGSWQCCVFPIKMIASGLL